MIVLVVIAVAAYWFVGTTGFVYWWTREFDLSGADLVVGSLIGLCMGPFAWPWGWFVHGHHEQPRTLIRRRQ